MIFDTSNPDEKIKGDAYWIKLSNSGKVVEIVNKKEKTPNQNRYLYALLNLIAIDMGIRLEKAKQYLKQTCPFMHSKEQDFVYLVSIADLDDRGTSDFINWLREWSPQELGLELLSSEDYKNNCHSIDKEIRRFKPYL